MYYKRTEFQFRLTILFTAATIAGATSGLLAYGIARMDGIAGYGGWRWIFILEGIATVVIGGIGLFFVRDWPATAKFLSEDERKLLDYRITHQTDDFSMNHWNKKTARRVFTDIKIYLGYVLKQQAWLWKKSNKSYTGVLCFSEAQSAIWDSAFLPQPS